ncbi:HlyD family secretion protein [Leptothoe sp. PORK10 BA2]|uniref:HlyD family secretion protein n=1 Tax=Leptothoe sp. PORK10 BA2 TaxID=3110254 RepID=UPI002B22177F|nr:HlyD family efflux transporter periplasmic adaptor subunit [Leptothoe sp. PORK10 BA2]MEA5466242.1 HlyD family efflux transporter periplasmic adaptor subunit [Leptothoe sp. PORK10 BA2]
MSDSQLMAPTNLPEIGPEDFLPPLRVWQRLGGMTGVIAIGTALVLIQTVTFSETVKAPAMIRPEGDLRLVEATAAGRISQIVVRENDQVKAGDAIAYLDDTQLQTKLVQLETSATQNQQQLAQIDNQLRSLEQRITATADQIQGSVNGSTAELTLAQQELAERELVNQADLRELQAEIGLAEENINRYRRLVDQGAIAVSQLREQEVALEMALARLARAQATAQPSRAELAIAQQQIIQTQSEGNATLARLRQESENLAQQRSNLLDELNQIQQELAQTQTDMTLLTLRAPVTGTIQSLELRNQAQVVNAGDPVAQIAAAGELLLAKAWVNPQDINTMELQQSAQLRISACPYTDYGTLGATVSSISPDTLLSDALPDDVRDRASGGLYEVTLQLSQPSLSTDQLSCHLQAGMTGRADILTRKETILKLVWRKLRLTTQL